MARPLVNDAQLFAAAVWLVHLAAEPTQCRSFEDIVRALSKSDVPAVQAVVDNRPHGTVRNHLSRCRLEVAAARACEPDDLLPGMHSWALSHADDWATEVGLTIVWRRSVRKFCERRGWIFRSQEQLLDDYDRSALAMARQNCRLRQILPPKAEQCAAAVLNRWRPSVAYWQAHPEIQWQWTAKEPTWLDELPLRYVHGNSPKQGSAGPK